MTLEPLWRSRPIVARSNSHHPYANVFMYGLPNPPFLKTNYGARLSVFHAKYWGVGVEQDESKWVRAHCWICNLSTISAKRGSPHVVPQG